MNTSDVSVRPGLSGPGRAAAVAALALVVLVVLFLGFGSSSYDVTLEFVDAGQIVKGNEVRIGGVNSGTVKSIKLSRGGLARVKISLDDKYAPLHRGTTAIVRQQSLSGVANRYVAISPGPNNAEKIPDGGIISSADTTSIVDLESLFETFDARTRRALQQVFAGFARFWKGNQSQVNAGAKQLAPALGESAAFARELSADEPALERFLVQGAAFVGALNAEKPSLTNLVTNTNTTLDSIASENASFSRALHQFPPNMRHSIKTFAELRKTMDQLDPLVKDTKPAARILPKFLDELQPFIHSAKPTIRDLRKTIRQPGAGNDLIDLLRGAPALRDAAVPAFASGVRGLRDAQDVIAFLRPYTPDLLGGLVQGFGGDQTIYYDANGRYAHVAAVQGPEGFTDTPLPAGQLAPLLTNLPALGTIPAGGTTPIVPEDLVPLVIGATHRCPGAATQPAQDQSNPFTDSGKLDCDPSQRPPGPGGS